MQEQPNGFQKTSVSIQRTIKGKYVRIIFFSQLIVSMAELHTWEQSRRIFFAFGEICVTFGPEYSVIVFCVVISFFLFF